LALHSADNVAFVEYAETRLCLRGDEYLVFGRHQPISLFAEKLELIRRSGSAALRRRVQVLFSLSSRAGFSCAAGSPAASCYDP
jgi:hypothetical protein